MDLINRNLIGELVDAHGNVHYEDIAELPSMKQWFEHLPSAQPEIIRCEECIHNGSYDTDCPIKWPGKEYCNFAERRKDG